MSDQSSHNASDTIEDLHSHSNQPNHQPSPSHTTENQSSDELNTIESNQHQHRTATPVGRENPTTTTTADPTEEHSPKMPKHLRPPTSSNAYGRIGMVPESDDSLHSQEQDPE